MNAVSCLVSQWLLELVTDTDLALDDLSRRLPVDLDHLKDPDRFVDWDVFVGLCEGVEQLFGDDKILCDVARRNLANRFERQSADFDAPVHDEHQLFWIAQRWLAPTLFPSLEIDLSRLHTDSLRLTVEISADARACPQLFRLLSCAIAVAPRLIERPDAHIALQSDDHRGVFTITVPLPAKPLGVANHATRERTGTTLRQRDERLLQSQKFEAIGRLAGGISHDFNNLLTAITGYGDLVLAELEPDSAVQRDVEEILYAARRAGSLTRQLLAISTHKVLKPCPVNLDALVSDVDRLLRRLIGEDIEFVTSLGSALDRVEVDAGQIEQLMMNLAVNSRDAMPEGGRLTLETNTVEVIAGDDRERSGI